MQSISIIHHAVGMTKCALDIMDCGKQRRNLCAYDSIFDHYSIEMNLTIVYLYGARKWQLKFEKLLCKNRTIHLHFDKRGLMTTSFRLIACVHVCLCVCVCLCGRAALYQRISIGCCCFRFINSIGVVFRCIAFCHRTDICWKRACGSHVYAVALSISFFSLFTFIVEMFLLFVRL